MKKVYAILLAVYSTCLLSCSGESPTLVTVGSGPSFSLTGSGRLASFTIYGPQSGQRIAFPHSEVATVLWQIKTSKGYFQGNHVQGLRLTYGKIPDGYTQVVPNSSESAPQLSPGAVYSFLAETTDAPMRDGFFFFDGTRPTQIIVPDLCLMLSNGHETRVDCRTKQPYQEPTNLEEIVRKNRVTK